MPLAVQAAKNTIASQIVLVMGASRIANESHLAAKNRRQLEK
jgi:hypothetical protein